MWRSGAAPDFLGVGSPLSGTLWWRGLLAQHPQIGLRRARHWRRDTFFEPFCERPMTDAEILAYHRRFRPRTGTVVGEWSDRYLNNPWMLPLLARAAPEARLLLVLRDPVDRFQATLGLRTTAQDPEAVTVYMTDAFHRGRYAGQLRSLYRFFGPERVLVLQYERLLADPRGAYRRTLEFLNVDPGSAPRRIAAAPRERTIVRTLLRRPVPAPVALWPDVEASLRAALTTEIAALKTLVPDLDLSLWPTFKHLAA